MAVPSTAEEFRQLVLKSGLVEPNRLQALPAGAAPVTAVAEELVSSGVLTRFQVQHLLAGRHRGLVLGPYRILQPLGRGGMGVVYLAEHSQLGRRVALKIFPADHLDNKAALARFQREGRAAAALDHPNIVRVYDVNRAANVHFLALELAEGQNLDQLLRLRGPLPIEEAVGYILQAAAALQHAHEKGIVHRDIKPANLVVSPSGIVKVLDMGLARFFDDRNDDLTDRLDNSAILGTADYISPEQALKSQVDIRADIYSLGATLYALLAGRPPFGGSTVSQKLMAHQMRTPEPLSSLRGDVPNELAAVVEKMMAKKAEDRYQTPAEVIQALAPWAAATALPVSSPPQNAPTGKGASSMRWVALVAVCVLTFAAAAAGGWWAMAIGKQAEPSEPTPAAPEAPKSAQVALLRVSQDWSRTAPFRVVGQHSRIVEREGELPAGWSIRTWNPDATAVATREVVEGKAALAMRMQEGPWCAMLFWMVPDVREGRPYALEFEYRTVGGSGGMIKWCHGKDTARALGKYPASDKKWRTERMTFTPERDDGVRLEFHQFQGPPNQALLLSRVALTEIH